VLILDVDGEAARRRLPQADSVPLQLVSRIRDRTDVTEWSRS
jgi:hypothetical protein